MKKAKIRNILLIVAGVLLLSVIGVGARLYYVAKIAPRSAFSAEPTPAPGQPDTTEQAPAETDATTDTPQGTPEPTEEPIEADTSFLKDNVNILLLGYDHSEERDDASSVLYRDEENNFRSDVLMLLSVNFENKTADLISVPRDTYYKIYDTNGKWKINAAFAKGGAAKGQGFEYAMKTISSLFGGIPINYYMGVDMIGLKAGVDAMGGVDYDVDVEIRLNGRVLKTGMQHLDGQQVLDYCRARKGISTDVGRVDRQQRMLFTIFEQLKSKKELSRLPRIYLAVQDKVKTNLNLEQIAALSLFATDLPSENLHRYTLDGKYMNVYNSAFYVLRMDKLAKLARDVLGVSVKKKIEYDVEYVTVDDEALREIKKAQELLNTPIPEEQKTQILAAAKAYLDATDEKKKNKSLSKIKELYQQLLDAMYGPQWVSPSPSALPTDTPLPTPTPTTATGTSVEASPTPTP